MLRQPADPATTTTTLLYGPSPQGSPFPPESQQRTDQLIFVWLVVVLVAFAVALAVLAWRGRHTASRRDGPAAAPN